MLRVALMFAVLAVAAALIMGANAHHVIGAFATAFNAGRQLVSSSPYSFAGVFLLIGAAWLMLSPRR